MIARTGSWSVLEAFAKFGFEDGDGDVQTDTVVGALETQGLQAEADSYGMHNWMIFKISKPHPHNTIPIWEMEFDGYHIPGWLDLPVEVRQAIVDLDPSMDLVQWRKEASDIGLDIQ